MLGKPAHRRRYVDRSKTVLVYADDQNRITSPQSHVANIGGDHMIKGREEEACLTDSFSGSAKFRVPPLRPKVAFLRSRSRLVSRGGLVVPCIKLLL
jgi:hypothetical protein